MPDDGLMLRRAIAAAPTDTAVRLAYTDWLEEHGQGPRAEYIRLCTELEARAAMYKNNPRNKKIRTRLKELELEHGAALLGVPSGDPAGLFRHPHVAAGALFTTQPAITAASIQRYSCDVR